jgi:hypothetical protein
MQGGPAGAGYCRHCLRFAPQRIHLPDFKPENGNGRQSRSLAGAIILTIVGCCQKKNKDAGFNNRQQ